MVDYYESLPEGYSVDDFFRVQFFKYDVDADGKKERTYMNTTYCKDMYQGTNDEILQREFYDGEFVCPDTEEITILNSPLLYQKPGASSFDLVVHSCEHAMSID